MILLIRAADILKEMVYHVVTCQKLIAYVVFRWTKDSDTLIEPKNCFIRVLANGLKILSLLRSKPLTFIVSSVKFSILVSVSVNESVPPLPQIG